ncbi:hypothetical protein HZS_4046 [Henneguya salminicola]|uniref:Large ribosomal subunit protein eL33 n=1 Tax=Henneguya salminicola TaxID=69463 RepID=A0A6G3MLI3_HENSL|nr:hypothetical protein HZS_4046 [Henneguya salminicola]
MVSNKPTRLYSKAVFSGFRRGKSVQHEQQSLVKIEGVFNRENAKWYLGKRVVYHYKGGKKIRAPKNINAKQKLKYRTIIGKVISLHGNSGTVRAKFHKNLPPQAIGRPLRVYLYPSII